MDSCLSSDLTFSVDQIEALSTMLNPDGETTDNQHVFGSALNPGSLHNGANKPKEMAKPGVKMHVAVNNRAIDGGALISEEQKADDAMAKKKEGKDIFTEEEINIMAEERPDDRAEPEFDVMFKQHVGTEDVYLGLSDRDPSSTHCDSLLVKVKLPG